MRLASAIASTRKGQITVIFAAGLVTFVGMLALTIDVGLQYTVKAQLQAAADVALLTSFAQVPAYARFDEQEKSLQQSLVQFQKANFGPEGEMGLRPTDAGELPWHLFKVTAYMDPITKSLVRAELQGRVRLDTNFSRVFGQETVDIPVWCVVEGSRSFRDGRGLMSAHLVQ